MKLKIKIPKIPKIILFGIDVIKNLMFFILFIVFSLILLATMAAPAIKYFKKEKAIYMVDKQKNMELSDEKDSLTKKYVRLKTQNQRTILSFNREFDKESFKHFTSKYITNIKISDKNISIYKKEFIKKSYEVEGYITTPTQFYKFVQGVNDYKNILEVKLPLEIKSNNSLIKVKFQINHIKDK